MIQSSQSSPPPAWPFIAPLAIFLLLGLLNPEISNLSLIDNPTQDPAIAAMNQAAIDASSSSSQRYLWVVGTQVLAVGTVLLICRKHHLEHFPWQISIWGPLTGVVGVVLWVVLCELRLEQSLIDTLHLPIKLPQRVSFNPWERLPNQNWLVIFLGLRFCLLAVIVPIAEELLLRGWFARWVQANDQWYEIGLRQIGILAQSAVLGYAVLAHPGEAFAAIVWFGLVNLLMVRTGRFWDCVLAHAVTNLLLGVYVVGWSAWYLW